MARIVLERKTKTVRQKITERNLTVAEAWEYCWDDRSEDAN
jgi:hypothetical protein